MRFEYRGVICDTFTYVRTIDKPWLLFNNTDDPFQMDNLINKATHADTQKRMEELLSNHLKKINDDFLPRENYYDRFQFKLDNRGKVLNLVENMYDRNG